MAEHGYGQFCPVAMACEVLCSRWTILVIRELLSGSTRFNDLRRGVPRMSPSLLSKRLTELEELGVIERQADSGSGYSEYHLTTAGRELESVVMAMGCWGQRWLESQLSLRNLDPSLLMWDMRRNLDPAHLPPGPVTIQFQYQDVARSQRKWWLVIDEQAPGQVVDLCMVDPGQDVDLYVVTDLRTMTAIWMGLVEVSEAEGDHRLRLIGAPEIASRMQQWLGLSVFARQKA